MSFGMVTGAARREPPQHSRAVRFASVVIAALLGLSFPPSPKTPDGRREVESRQDRLAGRRVRRLPRSEPEQGASTLTSLPVRRSAAQSSIAPP